LCNAVKYVWRIIEAFLDESGIEAKEMKKKIFGEEKID